MAIDITELRETLKINYDDMLNDRMMTNDLIVDDLMVELGYNKKRDKLVKRLFNETIDWEVRSENNECKLAVRVFALGTEIDTDFTIELKTVMEYCAEKKFSVLVVTDGKALTICRYDKEKNSYKEVIDISIEDELGETENLLLNAISKNEFSTEVIDKYILDNSVTLADVETVFKDNMSAIAGSLADFVKAIYGDIETIDSLSYTFFKNISNKEDTETSEVEAVETASTTSAEAEALKTQVETLKNENEQLHSLVDKLKNSSAEVDNNITEEFNAVKAENETLKSEAETLKLKIEALNDQLKSAQEAAANTEEVDRLKSEISVLKNELEGAQSVQWNEQSEKVDTSAFENEIATLKAENTELKQKYEEVKNNISTGAGDYIEQIRELNVKLSNANDEIDEYKAKLEEAENKLLNMSGADREKALELLNVIEDNPEMERHYVAVINSELIQFEKLHQFIGRSLQKLYELKNFEASQYIFNGDIFKLNPQAKHNDIIMNNKTYDIMLEGMHEDDALNKLRIVFSHFDDIVFECKKIGTLSGSSLIQDEVVDEVKEEVEVPQDEYIDDSMLEDVQINNEENTGNEQLAYGTEAVENTNDYQLLVAQLLRVDDLIFSDEDVQFSNIKYVGTNSVTFGINVQSNSSYDLLLCKCVDAILAIEAYNGKDGVINKLKHTDFSLINNFLKPYSAEYQGYPRINGTNFAVVGIDSVQVVASVLLDICNAMEINTEETFVYFTATTTSSYISEAYSFPEDSIQLKETLNYSPIEDEQHGYVVVKGDMVNNIVVTKNSLQAHKDILCKTVAVRTKYLSATLESADEAYELIQTMLKVAAEGGATVNLNDIGNLMGKSYKLLSVNENEVGENAVALDVCGNTIYCARIEDWQMIHSLIKIHTTLFNNTAIAVKNEVNLSAIEFYTSQFETAEPSLSLAVKTFADYMTYCIVK